MDRVVKREHVLKSVWVQFMLEPQLRTPSNMGGIVEFPRVMLGAVGVRAKEEEATKTSRIRMPHMPTAAGA
eukprot:9292584-Prorocentrum_lima.AAC.1